MAPVNTLSVLAFATAALAVPYNHGQHGHAKYHNNRPSGFSAYPYPNANGTIHPTGTGFATGAPIAPASETVVVSDVDTTTAVIASTYVDASSSPCTTDVTVTKTAKVTVTVTPGASSEAAPVESSPASASASSSSEAAAVQSSAQSSAPAYSQASSSSSEAAAVQSSAPAYSQAPTSYSSKAEAQTQSAPAAYSSPAPTSSEVSSAESSAAPSLTMTYAAANKNVDLGINYGGSSSSSSAAPSSSASSYSSSNSSGKGKRGVAYNDASLTECLVSSPAIGWGYNWGSSSNGLSDSVKFVPMLWGTKSEFTDSWSKNAQAAIDSGSTHLFSFNEPDLSAQANMTPQEAADAWKTYMEPFAGGNTKLCAPSVTNGGGNMGLNWLSSFLESCSDCTIDCLNVHWYDSAENVEYFKKHVNDALDLGNGKKEVFVSEFAATGSDDQISQFLETVMPWMDDMANVGGYAYFRAGEGKLVSGSEQSAIGKTYAS